MRSSNAFVSNRLTAVNLPSDMKCLRIRSITSFVNINAQHGGPYSLPDIISGRFNLS